MGSGLLAWAHDAVRRRNCPSIAKGWDILQSPNSFHSWVSLSPHSVIKFHPTSKRHTFQLAALTSSFPTPKEIRDSWLLIKLLAITLSLLMVFSVCSSACTCVVTVSLAFQATWEATVYVNLKGIRAIKAWAGVSQRQQAVCESGKAKSRLEFTAIICLLPIVSKYAEYICFSGSGQFLWCQNTFPFRDVSHRLYMSKHIRTIYQPWLQIFETQRLREKTRCFFLLQNLRTTVSLLYDHPTFTNKPVSEEDEEYCAFENFFFF